MTQRKNISTTKIRQALLERDGDKCQLCLEPLKDPYNGKETHVDHIEAHVWSGDDALENLRLVCSICNLSNGTETNESGAFLGKIVHWKADDQYTIVKHCADTSVELPLGWSRHYEQDDVIYRRLESRCGYARTFNESVRHIVSRQRRRVTCNDCLEARPRLPRTEGFCEQRVDGARERVRPDLWRYAHAGIKQARWLPETWVSYPYWCITDRGPKLIGNFIDNHLPTLVYPERRALTLTHLYNRLYVLSNR